MPSVQRVLAIMPDGVQSVITAQWDKLAAPGAIAEEIREAQTHEIHLKGWPDRALAPSVLIDALVWQAELRYEAHGGSDFTRPKGIGIGNFNDRSLRITNKSLAALKNAFATGTGLPAKPTQSMHAGYEIFEVTEKEQLYIAFANDHTVLTAEAIADIKFMLNQWKAGASTAPARWRDLLQHAELEAPMAILRHLDADEPSVFSGSTAEAATAWISDPARNCLNIKVRGADQESLEQAPIMFMLRDGDTIIERGADGWLDILSCYPDDRMTQGEMAMLSMMIFGVLMIV